MTLESVRLTVSHNDLCLLDACARVEHRIPLFHEVLQLLNVINSYF